MLGREGGPSRGGLFFRPLVDWPPESNNRGPTDCGSLDRLVSLCEVPALAGNLRTNAATGGHGGNQTSEKK